MAERLFDMSNMVNHVSIMDIEFINVTKKELLEQHLFPRLNRKQKTFVVTANPEIVMRARENPTFKQIVKQADYVVPDGAGVVIASKRMEQPLKERIPGYDLMIDLLAFCEKQELSCYFLGAKDYVLEKAIMEVEKKFPNLRIAGKHHGFFPIDDPAISKKVIAAKPDVVFLALGSPKQEMWITSQIDQFSKGLFMGVGGSFDVLAGEVKRAPESWINLNLEWLYRLIKQPFRWKRILKSLEFVIRIFFNRT